jgi:hypothetical protein
MRSVEDDGWEAGYWDDILHEFGVAGYIEARYGAQERRSSMDFTVSISGTKTISVDIDGDTIGDAAGQVFENETGDLNDVIINDLSVETEQVEVVIDFSATLNIELDDEDIDRLVRNEAENALSNAGVDDFDIDSVDQV